MKMKNIYYSVVFLLLLSCGTDELKELNVNPNAVNEVSEGFQFANAQLSTSNTSWTLQMLYCNTMMHQLASLETFWAGDKYVESASYATGIWGYYSGVNKLLVNIKETIKDDPERVNDYAMTRIWSAFIFNRITDLHGDVPYFEAGLGYLENKLTTNYDSQQDIYVDMLKELEESVAALTLSQPTYGIQDLVYQGDIESWKKFGNSLMLRLALRIADVDQATAVEYIQKAVSGGLMTSNDDICLITHSSELEMNRNQLGVSMVRELDNGTYTMAKYWIDWLQERNDPRLAIVALPNIDGEYKGLPNGYTPSSIIEVEGVDDVDIHTFYSKFNTAICNENSPNIFLTYAEVELMLAECVERGFINGNAELHYNNGVEAALKMFTIYDEALVVDQALIDTYLEENAYDPANALQQINEQYWAANFLNPIEAYANVRRSDYPVFPDNPYISNETNGKMPTRMIYPLSESINNADSYGVAVSKLSGGDKITSKVWWDVK